MSFFALADLEAAGCDGVPSDLSPREYRELLSIVDGRTLGASTAMDPDANVDPVEEFAPDESAQPEADPDDVVREMLSVAWNVDVDAAFGSGSKPPTGKERVRGRKRQRAADPEPSHAKRERRHVEDPATSDHVVTTGAAASATSAAPEDLVDPGADAPLRSRPTPFFLEGQRVSEEFYAGAKQSYHRIRVTCIRHKNCGRGRNIGELQCRNFGPLEPYAYLGVWLRKGIGQGERGQHVQCDVKLSEVEAYMDEMGWL